MLRVVPILYKTARKGSVASLQYFLIPYSILLMVAGASGFFLLNIDGMGIVQSIISNEGFQGGSWKMLFSSFVWVMSGQSIFFLPLTAWMNSRLREVWAP